MIAIDSARLRLCGPNRATKMAVTLVHLNLVAFSGQTRFALSLHPFYVSDAPTTSLFDLHGRLYIAHIYSSAVGTRSSLPP